MMRSLTFKVILICIHKVAATLVALHQKRTGEPDSVYFDCGRFTFSESILQETAIKAKEDAFQRAKQLRSFLYNSKQNYRTLDIPLKAYSSPTAFNNPSFFIVLDEMSHIIDVVSYMKNGHLIKCMRVDKSVPELSNIDLSREYSYECGHQIFSHDTIQSSITNAKLFMGKGIGYPLPYQGDLYRKELSYWIYPVLRKHKNLFLKAELDNKYFIVFTTVGEVIDIIAELMNGDYLKCTRMTKASGSALNKDLSVGYLCGFEYFEVNHLKRTADLAKSKARVLRRGRFPKKYYGPPLYSQQWIYPLLSDGKFYEGGQRKTNNYLVMDSSFEIQLAITLTKQVTKPCEETLRGLGIGSSESDNFKCKDAEFSNDFLLTNVQIACRSIGLKNRRFPAKYTGPPFDIPGPYMTWPLKEGKFYTKNPGRTRVVMNTECYLAGVISMWKDEYYKCARSKDNSVPGGKLPIPIREKLLIPYFDTVNSKKRKKQD